MALSGTVNGSVTNNSKYFSFYFKWSAVQSISGNYSDVTVETYWSTNNTWQEFDTVGARAASITINGETASISKVFAVYWRKTGTPYLIQTVTKRVYHNDDGTKSITISARANGHANSYGTSASTASKDDCMASKTVTLDTIARASVPTLSATSVKMGKALTITTNSKSSDFTHTLQYTFGGTTANIATGAGESYTWTVPDLASKCNNALEGNCTITCITYNGSTKVGTKTVDVVLKVPDATVPSFPDGDVIIGASNTIGIDRGSTNFTHTITYSFSGLSGTIVEKGSSGFVWWLTEDTAKSFAKAIADKTSGEGTITCTTYNGTATVGSVTTPFNAVVPNNATTKPQISSMALSSQGNLPSSFDGLYIQRKSKVVVDFEASTEYSYITGYTVTAQGKTYSGDPCTSDILSSSGSAVISGYVTDARGYPSEKAEQTITVIPYDLPKVVKHSGASRVICERCTSDGTLSKTGQYLKIKAGRSYSKVMDGDTQKNFCKLQYRYRTSSSEDFSDAVTLLDSTDTADEVDVALSGIVESLTSSYKVQLIVTDSVGEVSRYTFDISTATTDFHLREGGNGAAFGKYAEKDGVVESDWDFELYKDLKVSGMFSTGKAEHIGSAGEYNSLDFNDLVYKTCYYTGASSPSGAGCSNYPVDKTGMLEVISAMLHNPTTDNWWGFAYQTYRTYDGGIYTRSYYSDTGFTSWILHKGG